MSTIPLDLSALRPEEARAFARIEALVGGRVLAAERQARWRPAWFVDLACAGGTRRVYFRGDRGQGQGGGGTLERELAVLRTLHRHGIPAPHVYGFCEDPRGIVMERAPGRANLATAESEEERRAVLDHYVDLLAAMHAIDPAAFEEASLPRPADGRALALVDLPQWEKGYRRASTAPEPLIELCLRWLHRHVPAHREQVCFLTGDAGQFLFESGRVTAVIDLELATLGDPLADLGALRSRDISEPLGDLSRAYRRYAERSGEPIDLAALHFHAIRFALNTPLAVAPLLQRSAPGLDYAQYLSWKLVYGRLALEIIAEVEGIPLEAPGAEPDAEAPQHPAAHDALLSLLDTARAEGCYEADAAHRVGQYLRELDRRGDAVLARDLDEAGALLGRRPATRAEADAALGALAAAEPPRDEAALLRLLHRQTLRHESLLAPAMRELRDARFQKIRL